MATEQRGTIFLSTIEAITPGIARIIPKETNRTFRPDSLEPGRLDIPGDQVGTGPHHSGPPERHPGQSYRFERPSEGCLSRGPEKGHQAGRKNDEEDQPPSGDHAY